MATKLGTMNLTGMLKVEKAKIDFEKEFTNLQTETTYFLNGFLVQNFKKISSNTYAKFTTQ